MQQNIALYLRLSLEDDDMVDESNSITNQRILLYRFLKQHKEFTACNVREFNDDGYSGTNMNRPAFQNMIALAKTGEINIIIVKDLSRFGRNHIEVDNYLEQFFPFLGIRFISVNDHIDSLDYADGLPGADVGFRNITNEYYSRDISMKVRTALVSKMQEGKYIGARPPYGYLRSEEDAERLTPDPQTAPVVKMIFHMYLDGYNLTQLTKYLNENNIMPPGQYKREILQTDVKKTTKKDMWYVGTVRGILMTETYTGTCISGKYRVEEVGSSKHIKIDEEKWIKVAGAHEAIISREIYDAVQKRLEQLSRKKKTNRIHEYPMKGILICGGCGQKMQYISRCRKHFICGRKFNKPTEDCFADNLYEEELNRLVYHGIQNFAGMAEASFRLIEEQKAEMQRLIDSAENEIKFYKDSIERNQSKKAELYMNFALDEISQEQYLKKNTNLDKEIETMNGEIAKRKEKQQKAADRILTMPEQPDWDWMSVLSQDGTLTREAVTTFIKEIIVWPDKRLDITWNFDIGINNCVNDLT